MQGQAFRPTLAHANFAACGGGGSTRLDGPVLRAHRPARAAFAQCVRLPRLRREASTRLLFIARSRSLGLTCDQVSELLPVWAGVDCVSAHARVGRLIDDKQVEIAARIAELTAFAAQLDDAKASLEASPPPQVCCDDLTCCVPSHAVESVPIDLGGRHELSVI